MAVLSAPGTQQTIHVSFKGKHNDKRQVPEADHHIRENSKGRYPVYRTGPRPVDPGKQRRGWQTVALSTSSFGTNPEAGSDLPRNGTAGAHHTVTCHLRPSWMRRTRQLSYMKSSRYEKTHSKLLSLPQSWQQRH